MHCDCTMFESNVILDRYKTNLTRMIISSVFESNVILDRYKTRSMCKYLIMQFESNVIKKWCQRVLSTPLFF